jgi:hypothetical protein
MLLCIIYGTNRSKRSLTPTICYLLSCDEFLEMCYTFRFTSHIVIKGFRLTYYTLLEFFPITGE